ncbi:MAG: TonB family protein [Pseudomonadota bacterium]
MRGEGVAAGPPARLALQIVQAQGATSGVDPLIAHLVEGQTELASDAPSGRDTLVAALAEADQRTGIDDDAYPAALSLAHWAIEHHQFDIARNAWNSAGRHAGGAMIDPDLARANAQIGVAATFIVEGGDANLNSAEPILSDVMQRIGPAAGQDSPDHAITEAQRTYAQATAWWGTREALLGTRARAANSSNPQNRPADISHSEFCTVTWEGVQHTVSSRYYPQRALEHGQQGVVVVRVIFADNGTVVRGDVVAAAPDQVFNQSAISVATTGRIRRADGQPSTCVLPHVLFKVINFVGAASGHGGQTW